jgi:hypothetical protein
MATSRSVSRLRDIVLKAGKGMRVARLLEEDDASSGAGEQAAAQRVVNRAADSRSWAAFRSVLLDHRGSTR